MSLTAQETNRHAELKAKLLDKNGDYVETADVEELKEYAILDAKQEDVEPPANPVPDEETEKPEKSKPVIEGMSYKPVKVVKKVPSVVRPQLKRGFVYCGADSAGLHILYHPAEEMFYRLNRDPNFVDALGDGLQTAYLESLK